MTKPIRYPDFQSGISLPDADLADEMPTAADLAPPPPPAPPPAGPLDFAPVPVAPRINGWTAHRQRLFIRTLAETASVAEACEAAGVTSRSAYRLRLRPGAESFDAAWRRAYELGAHRLTAIAFERALNGTPREIRKNGELIGEVSMPSDRLLMFLLQRYDSMRYGKLSGLLPVPVPDPTENRARRHAAPADVAQGPARSAGLRSFRELRCAAVTSPPRAYAYECDSCDSSRADRVRSGGVAVPQLLGTRAIVACEAQQLRGERRIVDREAQPLAALRLALQPVRCAVNLHHPLRPDRTPVATPFAGTMSPRDCGSFHHVSVKKDMRSAPARSPRERRGGAMIGARPMS